MSHLRDYQQDIIHRIHKEWQHHRSVMAQMPTGTGKTHVLASIVSAFSGRVLIVAHRVELIAQIKETVEKLCIRQKDLNIASIQTVSRRIQQLDIQPSLVIIDEAHHALAKTYRILWEKWPEAKFLGLTATPCRMNRAGFTDLFDSLVTSWSIADFIEKGVLSAFDYVSIHPHSAEQQLIDSLEKRGADGDFQVKEMDEVLNKQPSIERLYRSVQEFAKGKKGIVYAISIDHARKIAAYYNQQGLQTFAIDSKTPQEVRKQGLKAFKKGEIQVLVNVDVFSEGFDCPDVEFVQLARPTLSLAKYLQQVGRGLRQSAGKESCMLIDNVGLYRIFGLPVRGWNWERMFRGDASGKGVYPPEERTGTPVWMAMQVEAPEQDPGLGWVVSHDKLLSRLHELTACTEPERPKAALKAWQDPNTGLWGLRRGKEKTTTAQYITIFDIKNDRASVRFSNHCCGLVDDAGNVLWKKGNCIALRGERNGFLKVVEPKGKESYIDLHNLQEYIWKPEVKKFGGFELLKVRHKCYSRTKEVYASDMDFEGMYIADKRFYLAILEHTGRYFCLLKGDDERVYRLYRKLEDESIIVTDQTNRYYHVDTHAEKAFIGQGNGSLTMEQIVKNIPKK